jgi:hypothetical protein
MDTWTALSQTERFAVNRKRLTLKVDNLGGPHRNGLEARESEFTDSGNMQTSALEKRALQI